MLNGERVNAEGPVRVRGAEGEVLLEQRGGDCEVKKTRMPGDPLFRYTPRAGVMNVPFGWMFEEGTGRIVENGEEQGVIVLVKELAGAKVSMNGIAARLTERGVRNRGSSRWRAGTVHRVLHYEGLRGGLGGA